MKSDVDNFSGSTLNKQLLSESDENATEDELHVKKIPVKFFTRY